MTKRAGLGLQRSWPSVGNGDSGSPDTGKRAGVFPHSEGTKMASQGSHRSKPNGCHDLQNYSNHSIKLQCPTFFIGFISWFQRSGIKGT